MLHRDRSPRPKPERACSETYSETLLAPTGGVSCFYPFRCYLCENRPTPIASRCAGNHGCLFFATMNVETSLTWPHPSIARPSRSFLKLSPRPLTRRSRSTLGILAEDMSLQQGSWRLLYLRLLGFFTAMVSRQEKTQPLNENQPPRTVRLSLVEDPTTERKSSPSSRQKWQHFDNSINRASQNFEMNTNLCETTCTILIKLLLD